MSKLFLYFNENRSKYYLIFFNFNSCEIWFFSNKIQVSKDWLKPYDVKWWKINKVKNINWVKIFLFFTD